MSLKRTENLEGTMQSLDIMPLSIDLLNEFYVNTIEGRGDNPIKHIERLILNNTNDTPKHILFSGYRGCGKTTELNYLTKSLVEKGIFVINFSVYKELDPVTINHVDLYIVLMEKLLKLSKEKGLKIDDAFVEKLKLWTETDEIRTIKSLEGSVGVEAKAGVEVKKGIPFLAKFFGSLSASVKASGSYKKEITSKIEPKLFELIGNVNLLIGIVKRQLWKENIQNLLIIIEDLDKLDIPKAQELFYDYSPFLNQIAANTIFTFPISLLYHTKFNTIKSYFSDICELPTIKVFNRDGSPNKEGREILRKIVGRRMSLDLFEEDVLESFLVKSGGCIRDLFRMLLTASSRALDYEKEKISRKEYCKAYWRLRNEYANSIAEKRQDGEVIKYEEYIKALILTYESADKTPPNSNAVLDLRQNLCILSYNDTQWFDLHPVVKDFLIDKESIKADGADPHKCTA